MTFLGESDIDVMLADLSGAGGAVDVTLGATTVKGIMDHDALEVLDEEGRPGVIGSEKSVHVKTGALSGLTSGASITVGGTSYKVLKVLPYGDGAMTRVVLRTS